MAEEAKAEAPTAESAAPSFPSGSKIFLILVLVNTVTIVGALGALIYTRLLYKRPAITEKSERERLEQTKLTEKTKKTESGLIRLEPITVNIKPTPNKPRPADGSPVQIEGKLHYANIGISLEIKDLTQQNKFDAVRPVFMDELLSRLGRKSFDELSSVQGRYVLRTEIVEMANQIIKEALITNVFFTEFIVQ